MQDHIEDPQIINDQNLLIPSFVNEETLSALDSDACIFDIRKIGRASYIAGYPKLERHSE